MTRDSLPNAPQQASGAPGVVDHNSHAIGDNHAHHHHGGFGGLQPIDNAAKSMGIPENAAYVIVGALCAATLLWILSCCAGRSSNKRTLRIKLSKKERAQQEKIAQDMAKEREAALKEDEDSQPQSEASDGEEDTPEKVLRKEIARLKKRKMKLLMQDAGNIAMLEKLTREVVTLEDELEEHDPKETQEMRQARIEKEVKASDFVVEGAANPQHAFMQPFVQQARKICHVINQRRYKTQYRFLDFGTTQAREFLKDIKLALEHVPTDLQDLEVPDFSLILSSALAPAQLMGLNETAWWAFGEAIFYVLVSGFCVSMGPHGCPTSGFLGHYGIYNWFVADIGFYILMALIYLRAILMSRTAIAKLSEEPPPTEQASPEEAARNLMDFYVSTGCHAMTSYKKITQSCIHTLRGFVTLGAFMWMFFGVDLMINTEWRMCTDVGHIRLSILRLRVCLFLMFFLQNVFFLIMFFLSLFLASETFDMLVLTTCDQIDTSLGTGFPFITIIAHGLLGTKEVRKQATIDLRVILAKQALLRRDILFAEGKFNDARAEKYQADDNLERIKRREEEERNMTLQQLVDRRTSEADSILDFSEAIFGQIRDKAEAELDPDHPDPRKNPLLKSQDAGAKDAGSASQKGAASAFSVPPKK